MTKGKSPMNYAALMRHLAMMHAVRNTGAAAVASSHLMRGRNEDGSPIRQRQVWGRNRAV